MSASKMRIGDNTLCVHTLSDVDDLPGSVQTDTRYEKYSTDRSDCRLSFAAPVGLMLSCDHIYNQFLFIDDSAEILQRFEKTAYEILFSDWSSDVCSSDLAHLYILQCGRVLL